jgi:hypothetical protein
MGRGFVTPAIAIDRSTPLDVTNFPQDIQESNCGPCTHHDRWVFFSAPLRFLEASFILPPTHVLQQVQAIRLGRHSEASAMLRHEATVIAATS